MMVTPGAFMAASGVCTPSLAPLHWCLLNPDVWQSWELLEQSRTAGLGLYEAGSLDRLFPPVGYLNIMDLGSEEFLA